VVLPRCRCAGRVGTEGNALCSMTIWREKGMQGDALLFYWFAKRRNQK